MMRTLVPQRLPGLQRVLNPLERFSLATQPHEGLALEVENVIFADRGPMRQRTAREHPRKSPADGDVVIAPVRRRDGLCYALSVAPGPPQIMCRTYQEALANARAWAIRTSVRIWLAGEGGHYWEATEAQPTGLSHGPMHASDGTKQ